MSKYGYDYVNGGFVGYEGVSADGKDFTDITIDRENSTVTAHYSDGTVYAVTADISNNGNTTTINSAFGTWTNAGTETDVPAKYSLMAMLLQAGSGSDGHPDKLSYTDDDTEYTLPEGITPLTGETFDTVTELWRAKTADEQDAAVVWGIGVLNKGADNEKVSRMIYTDGTWIDLTDFDSKFFG